MNREVVRDAVLMSTRCAEDFLPRRGGLLMYEYDFAVSQLPIYMSETLI